MEKSEEVAAALDWNAGLIVRANNVDGVRSRAPVGGAYIRVRLQSVSCKVGRPGELEDVGLQGEQERGRGHEVCHQGLI